MKLNSLPLLLAVAGTALTSGFLGHSIIAERAYKKSDAEAKDAIRRFEKAVLSGSEEADGLLLQINMNVDSSKKAEELREKKLRQTMISGAITIALLSVLLLTVKNKNYESRLF